MESKYLNRKSFYTYNYMYKNYKLTIVIKHSDDWTVFTDRYNIEINTINYFVLPHINKIIDNEFFSFYVDESLKGNQIDAKNFLDSIKNNNNVKKIDITFTKVKPNMKYYYITTIEDYGQSIRKIINEHMGIFALTQSRNGLEYYTIYFLHTSKEEINALKEELQNTGDLKLFDTQAFKSISGIFNPLFTQSELRIMKIAYEAGFFNYPRSIDLNELSKKVGITKSALNLHLKNAMLKTLNYLYHNDEDNYK